MRLKVIDETKIGYVIKKYKKNLKDVKKQGYINKKIEKN